MKPEVVASMNLPEYVTEFNLPSLRANVELAGKRKLLAKSFDVNVIMWKHWAPEEITMLNTLADKVRPEHCAVLLVDVQNDFCADGGAMHREGRDLSLVQAMIPRLERFLGAARAAGVKCVWIKNVYNTGPNWYLSEVWLEQARRRRKGAYVQYPVCEPGEWNGDFFQIRPRADEAVVTKHRYGAFESTDLDLVLRSQGIRTVIMTGIATNVCVETTARQAFLRDYYVVFTSDCTATFTQAEHDATLHNIDQFFGQVVNAEEVMACWPACGSVPAGRLRVAP